MQFRRVFLVAAALVLAMRIDAHAGELDKQTFVGSWKENPAKTHVVPSEDLTYTFSNDTDGFVSIVRGGVQLRDRVRFDGQDYPAPGIAGRTVSWTKVNDATYETTIKMNDRLLGKGTWTLSDGGKLLTQVTRPVRADGQNDANTMEYVRTSGEGMSLIGIWKPVSSRSLVPDLFIVSIDEGALKVFYPKNQSFYTMTLDGKEYPQVGPRALPDSSSIAEAIGPQSVRRTTLRAHRPALETVMTVSPDGRSMTIITLTPGSSGEPSTFVYEKQD